MIIAVAGYALAALLVFGRALFPPQGQMIFGDDIHHQYVFYREFFTQSLRHGIFPWWNPYMFGGEPFIANPVVNIWYPPTWIFSLLPIPIAYGWHLFFHVVWAMTGMYVLVNRITRNNDPKIKDANRINPAAWVSGVVFGLSGFFMARTYAGHVDVVAAASWIPWVVWSFYRLGFATGREYKKWFVWSSVLLVAQLFAGYQTMAMMSVIIVGVVTVTVCIQQKRFRPLFSALAAGTTGLLLAAIQVLPVQEFFRMSIRTYGFPYAWHAYGSLEWRSFWQLLNPFIFGNVTTYAGPPPNFIEHSMFVGVSGLILAIIGLLSVFRSRTRLQSILGAGVLVVVILGFWISLGSNARPDLQYILWKLVPMYRYLRIPPRHIILSIFGLSLLSGFGASYLFRILRPVRMLPFIVLALVAGELVLFGRNFIELQPVPSARHDKELIALLKSDTEPYRVLQDYGVWLPSRDAMDFDSGLTYGIYSATGYDPSILRPYFEYIANASGQSGKEAVIHHDVQVPYLGPQSAVGLDRLNIKYIQVPRDHDPFMGVSGYRNIRENAAFNYRVYENTSVLPRFFLAAPCGTVNITSYGANQIALAVSATCTTTLESSEIWYPGWEAFIDGKKTSINKTDNVFRTLFISPGNYTVVYRYNPGIFVIGAGISILTAMALFYWVRLKAHEDVSA